MRPTAEAELKLAADTEEFNEAMKEAQRNAEAFARTFTRSVSSAVVSGKSLEDTLRSLAIRLSELALNQALAPVENAFAQMIAGIAAPQGGSVPASPATANPSNGMPMNVVFNVNSPNPGSFRQSEGQLAALLARTVQRGQSRL